MTTTNRSLETLARAALCAALILLASLAAPLGQRSAHAEGTSEEQVHSIVSDRVLGLMGLTAEHTVLVGARLPGRPAELFAGLGANGLRDAAKDIWEQNREDLVSTRDLERRASSFAVAVALDGGADEGLWEQPFGIEWLTLEDVSLVFAFSRMSRSIDMNPTISALTSDPRGGTLITKDGASLQIGIAATCRIGGVRLTCAITLSRDVDVKAQILSQVKKLRKKKGGKQEELSKSPETNSTVSHKGIEEEQDDEIESVEDAGDDDYIPGMQQPTEPAGDDGTVKEGTKAPKAAKDPDSIGISIALLVDELGLPGVCAIAESMGINGPLQKLSSNKPFVLSEVMVALELDARKLAQRRNPVEGVSIFGMCELLDGRLQAYGLVSLRRIDDRWVPFAGFRVSEFYLKDIAPGLEDSLAGGLWLPSVAFTRSWGAMTVRSTDLNPAEQAFYDDVCVPFGQEREKQYTLNFKDGMNITGPLPMAVLPAGVLAALGLPSEASGGRAPYVILEGNPGLNLGLDFGGLPRLADMSLRATLPPISPEGAPKWLVKGELYLEVTGRPSLAIGGALTVNIQGDELRFFIEGSLAREGAGVSIALTGGMADGEPWRSPFGVEWMTLNEVIAKIAVNVNGNVSLGFAADMVIGTKVVDIAALVAINAYSGLPTNFIVEGRTNKIALDDLAALQEKIAAAAGRSAQLPIGLLPNVEVRDMYFRFAPRADADLGVEAGLGVAGALWIEQGLRDTMDRVAEVDVEIGVEGISLFGYVRGYALGPVTWNDAQIDLKLVPGSSKFTIEGAATVVNKSMHLSVNLTPRGMFDDFVDAHGAAIGAKVDAAKAAVANVKAKIKSAAPVLRGRKRVVRSVRRKLRR